MKPSTNLKTTFFVFSILMTFSSKSQNLNSLILHYTFDNSSLQDDIANNDIQSIGATPCEDRFGNLNFAYEFNNSYLLTPTPLSLGALNQASVSVWIKPDASEFSTGTSTLMNPGFWGIYFNKFSTSGKILGMMDGSSNNNSISDESSILAQNEWVFVTLTNNGTVSKLYINGLLQTTYNEQFAFTDNANALYIGARGYSTSTPTDFFNGKIDDFRVYSSALTAVDIDSLYNSPNPTTGIESLTTQENLIKIYPNPVNDILILDFNTELQPNGISISDISGNIIDFNYSQNNQILDVSQLKQGTYFLTILFDDNTETLKFIKL